MKVVPSFRAGENSRRAVKPSTFLRTRVAGCRIARETHTTKAHAMKKLVAGILAMLLSLGAFAQTPAAPAAAPKKNTLSVYRVIPKPGHADALEKALTAHAQKFHTGNWKWRVSSMLTGPESNGYQIAEGPNSWTDIDGRGDLGPDHNKDYDANVSPHVERSTPEMYVTYVEAASTVPAANWSTKSQITHLYFKPGRGPATLEVLKLYKKAWEKMGHNVVIWSPLGSGEPQYIIVRRFKNGFKDLDMEGQTMREAFDEVNGAGSFAKLADENNKNLDHTMAELMEFKPELSSK
jgi:hypothetical protein